MSRLLIITQKVDEADDLLGFFVSWIREFATHFEHVTVITLAKGVYSLPSNVRVLSLGKENRVSKIRQAWRFFHLLRREVRNHDAVFAHMSPIFAIATAPFTKYWHKKLVLWYLHRSTTLKLRLALAMADTLVTADAHSLSVSSTKIVSVGHGIDVARFAVRDRTAPNGRPLHILSVGRISPIKGFETLIRAAVLLRDGDVPCEVRIVGKAVMPGDQRYEEQLHALVTRFGIGDIVRFFGFAPYCDMPAHYRWADIVVGCTPSGGIDKVLLESMAAGCIVLTSNHVMKQLLGEDAVDLVFSEDNSREISQMIIRLDDYEALSSRMTQYVSNQTTKRVVDNISHFL